MTKTKPESEFILVRGKHSAESTKFTVCRNNEKLDLSDLVYLKTMDNGIEEWVHTDDYKFYYDMMHKHDDLKEWAGSEDHKEFQQDLKALSNSPMGNEV